MRIIIVIVCALTTVLLPLSSGYADAKGVSATEDKPVFVVDIQKVIDQSRAGKLARSKIEEEAKLREAKIIELKGELQSVRADLEKQKSLLSPEALSEKEGLARKKEKEIARTFQDQDEELSRKNNVEIERIVRRIDRAVAALVKGDKYSLVLEKEASLVVYSDPKFEMTDKIIAQLDSEDDKS